VEGERSFDDLVRSVKEPAKDYVKPVDKDALAYLVFSSGTTGPPKGEATFAKSRMCRLARVHRVDLSRRHDITQESHVLSDAGFHCGGTKQSGCTGQLPLPESDLPASWTSVLAPAIHLYPSCVGPRTILPQLRVEHFLLPYVFGSIHGGHRAQMGPKVCHGTYSKVRPSAESYNVPSVAEHPVVHVKVEGNVNPARTIDGPPVSEYPGVGGDGYQYC